MAKTRIDVFSELTSPDGVFNFQRCEDLLGDNYDNFIRFCDHVQLIPEDIETLEVIDVSPERHKAIFGVTLCGGESLQFES